MLNNLIFNENAKQFIVKCLYRTDKYLTFEIQVKSGEFSGASNFCISEEKITETIKILNKMHQELKGSCEIRDYDSDAYIVISICDNLGYAEIFGQIGGSHQDHYMKFKYIADQTILDNLIQIFKDALKK